MTKKQNWPKLPKKFKKKWIKALRSGKYKQGSNFLKNGDRYCCLGVACEVQGIKLDELLGTIPLNSRSGKWKRVPKVIRGSGPNLHGDGGNLLVEKLVLMNDGGEYSNTYRKVRKRGFKYIANWIERNL